MSTDPPTTSVPFFLFFLVAEIGWVATLVVVREQTTKPIHEIDIVQVKAPCKHTPTFFPRRKQQQEQGCTHVRSVEGRSFWLDWISAAVSRSCLARASARSASARRNAIMPWTVFIAVVVTKYAFPERCNGIRMEIQIRQLPSSAVRLTNTYFDIKSIVAPLQTSTVRVLYTYEYDQTSTRTLRLRRLGTWIFPRAIC